jgi:DNA adenine methylase
MAVKLTPPLKYHGGKSYLAPRIVELMPPHVHYVEPFAGGLSVLLARNPEGVSEVANDLCGDLTNFWRVLQGTDTFDPFRRRIEATPFSEREWTQANPQRLDDVDVPSAVAFFVRCRQSLAGRMDSFAPLSRTRTRSGMNEQASAWWNAVEGLRAVHSRLKRVVILNRDALDVIRSQDGPQTFFYLDPPYLQETRTAPVVYSHEMTREEHVKLLDLLGTISGTFALSGYRNPLYDSYAERFNWKRHDFDLPNHAAGGKTKRRMTESLWFNYRAERVAIVATRSATGEVQR